MYQPPPAALSTPAAIPQLFFLFLVFFTLVVLVQHLATSVDLKAPFFSIFFNHVSVVPALFSPTKDSATLSFAFSSLLHRHRYVSLADGFFLVLFLCLRGSTECQSSTKRDCCN